jgi:Family of unknown function (DUF5926)
VSKRAKPPRGSASTATATADRKKIRDIFVARPFEGLVDEPQWIALRELVPAASAPLSLVKEYAERYPDRQVTLATILPMALPAMAKADGRILLGLQRHQQSGDVSRDLAATLLAALETEPGSAVEIPPLPGPGPRLQDILEPVPMAITLHTGFDFWLDEGAADDPSVRASLDRANASIYPTEALSSVPAAYWCRLPERAHVRWVLPEQEDRALDALARVGAAGGLLLGAGTKFAGMFRAHGRLVPVWDLPTESGADAWEAPVAAFSERYAAALDLTAPLTTAERGSRQGLLGRQLTLR